MELDLREMKLKEDKQQLLSLLYECEHALLSINSITSSDFYYKNYFGHLITKLEKDLESQYDIV